MIYYLRDRLALDVLLSWLMVHGSGGEGKLIHGKMMRLKEAPATLPIFLTR